MACVRVVIIDYGAGNLRSVARAVAWAGGEPVVSSRPQDVLSAPAVVMPGVGAAADTMRNLQERGLVEAVREYIAQGRPFLGVCMGQQVLFDYSLEGGYHPCLGVLAGRVVRLPDGLKVPHMGWNRVRIVRPHPFLEGIEDGEYFYFVHSYYPEPSDPGVVIAVTEYGVEFPAAVARGALVATQFHPEKSGRAGLLLYRNFLRLARTGGER
ncbi:MAG TPA: imidazole glycerol phosphate synthase subunit HisH [Dehalococcoidia bacterium]|nr:imidazole glycerol phosphate synthase subunit HisH [Dehalococcoidia bacterium]